MSDELRTVARYNTPIEADLARNRLEAAGIQAFVADEQTIGWLWHLGTALHGIKVQVRESELVRATEILDEVAEPPAEGESLRPWVCPKCGQCVESDFAVCWSCGTTVEGIEDPEFQPAGVSPPEPSAERGRTRRAPGPMLALLFGFFAPVLVVNALVGFNVVLAEAVHPLSVLILLLLGACEFLLVVGLFQWWWYQEPSDRVEIPGDRTDMTADEPSEPEPTTAEALARRACLAAVLGVAFCPPLLNFYSIWLIVRHELYLDSVSGQSTWLVYAAMLINAAVCFALLLLWLACGGLVL